MTTLSILLEGNACSWGKLATNHGNAVISDVIRSVVSFANAHLSLSSGNKLLLFMFASGLKKKLLFNSRRSASTDFSIEMIKAIRETLHTSASTDDISTATPLAGVLCHSICHMKQSSNSDLKEASSENPTITNTHFINGRVVIISMTEDFGSEHGPLMNLFFSSAKHGICVDVISLGPASPLLQQAADITSGMFIQIDNPKKLLCKMMTNVLGHPSSRSIFPQPHLTTVDYRASCACHHQLVSTGWVCSVCLSVLCQFVPICTSCGAVFKISGFPKKVIKRKRKE
ncbi:unnamed protein product [Auanema sp. JU1783]|nr:unnamed protein product [Auanema sp. JU1783]